MGSGHERALRGEANAIGHGLSVQPMYDGDRTHLLGTFATERFTATLIWAWLEEAGVAVSVGF